MTLDIAEFYQTFFDEADELLDEMERLLINLDIDAPDSEDLNAIFRAAHSIKGGAGTFGFTHLQETTHLLENLLDRARHGELVLDRPAIDLFLECRDVLAGQDLSATEIESVLAWVLPFEPDRVSASGIRAALASGTVSTELDPRVADRIRDLGLYAG